MATHKQAKAKREPDKIRVMATATGLYGALRQPGDQFHLEDEAHFHPSWMEHVDENGVKVERSPVLKAHRRHEHERLVRHAQQLKMQREMGDVIPPFEEEEDDSPEEANPVNSDDLGVINDEGVLQQEINTGSPLVQTGSVGRPGQDDQTKPQTFDAKHSAEQNFTPPHQFKDGTVKPPKPDDKDAHKNKKVI